MNRRLSVATVVAMLIASLLCVAIAPALMPESYSVLEHSVSESAGQGVPHAWLARLGFLLLGFAVLLETQLAGPAWGLWGRIAHRIYGVSMIAVAAFAHMPWEDVPYDAFEDSLHSVAATAVGFAFTGGVIAVGIRRGRRAGWRRALDTVAVLAAVVLPMLMFAVAGVGGLVQRVLFGIGYLWYGLEAVRLGRAPDRRSAAAAPGT